MQRTLQFSVVIPTCNRPDDVRRCLDSFAHVVHDSWDVTIIDQSDDDHTRAVVDQFAASLPQLRYRRLHAKGTSRARNVGAEASTGEIIAFLDDDCTVPPEWLARVAAVWDRHPDAGIVFGSVRPSAGLAEWAEHGWTPAWCAANEMEVGATSNLRDLLRLPYLLGMGACMFVRRDVAVRVGPFDVHMGPGSRFLACEDGDWAYRAVRAGCSFVATPDVVVEHHGFRDYASGAARRLNRDYQFGTATWLMKLVRMGDPLALFWIADQLYRYGRFINLRRLLPGQGESGLSKIVMFVLGLASSFQLSVDRQRGLYVNRSINW